MQTRRDSKHWRHICKEAATSGLSAETAVRRLGEFEEAIGILEQTCEVDGECVAAFSWGSVSLSLEMTDRLQSMVGKKIGILRLNGYHLRCLEL